MRCTFVYGKSSYNESLQCSAQNPQDSKNSISFFYPFI
ncbi:Hypothetical protein BN2458_PEG0858 [Helicobacter typhlonius]|uniref:Uncharacterized protein n=1 Tax=Helicobacter typhlonius TaxID=76936 RepID=A0A0S4PWM4_9HELI|nr:Hypothetical protein BN2458_PEG0858 [Helicobacter typhlonius]